MQPLSVVFPCGSGSATGSLFTTTTKVCSRRDESSYGHHHQKKQRQRQQEEPRFLRCLASPLVAAILTLSSPSYLISTPVSLGQSVDVSPNGAALFQRSCIGCHDGGGNILQPGATLFTKDLQRNGIATEEEIYNITYYGKGRMPGFGEKCTPRGQCTFGARLQDDEIKLLAEFVKSQADRGWPNVESYGD